MAGNIETDDVTGTETTGHEWDGIKELNTPLPRWWLYSFLACIVWSVGYWILMPAWPLISGYTSGVLGYSSRAMVVERIGEARSAQSKFVQGIAGASLEDIRKDPELLEFALAGGRSVFSVNCSQCHGRGAAGSPGYANLNDDAWLWGGTLEAISQTINYGIRSSHDDSRLGDMPGFVSDETLTRAQAGDVAAYVLSLSNQEDDATAAQRGAEVFAETCIDCHMEGGTGNPELGAPNLADSIWLYGGDKKTVLETIAKGRAGVMPAWTGRLSQPAIKQLAVYVHSLGGGQ